MNKNQVRQLFKDKRKQLTADEITEKSIAIANQLLKLNIWDKEYYHVFLTIERLMEIETESILTLLMAKEKSIVVSRTDIDKGEMKHYLLNEETKLKESDWGILEPISGQLVPSKKIDVVFVPLLGYDKKGNRVGYGKGFYDRFLKQTTAEALLIGLSFFEPIDGEILMEETDVPMGIVVTPDNIIYCE
ncbi:5-formyltetrahydrofolate cyclo-ligase [Capnocytophaga sp. ARDL2]|uniref:5-formyltetrahydrofolate cyclo-ligase n=1 Tax=Capnocytophaga sp. ARDL2 TaxID=3238809 RepID=UPI003557F9A5